MVRKETRVHPPGQPTPAREASLAELVAKINAWSDAIHTLNATVDLAPTAGSVYSGVIKEYHDVKGFILLQKPSTLRMQGQAPVVRTEIFDMVSNGGEFRLYIPSKQKYIIGKTTFQHPAKNALENLRPQHILQALIVPPIDADHETTYREKLTRRSEPAKRYFVVNIIELQTARHAIPRRKAWFDRADLELVRSQFYEPDGTCTEDVQYSNYQDFQGIHYPTHIELNRPEDDYEVTLTIEKATFNDPIPPEKFNLEKPEGAELVNLSAPKQEEHRLDQ
jgi:outer membrane lipoprotein-sorting protein